jgi:hypothetical protein
MKNEAYDSFWFRLLHPRKAAALAAEREYNEHVFDENRETYDDELLFKKYLAENISSQVKLIIVSVICIIIITITLKLKSK